MKQVLEQGTTKTDRTQIGTISTFGMQQRYDLSQGFPAVTTKKLAWRAVVGELLWFVEGSGDEKRLREILHGSRQSEKTTIWTANATAPYWQPQAQFEGDLQKIYGYQWRKWNTYSTWTEQVVLIEQGTKQGIDAPFSLHIPLEECDFTDSDDFVGKIFETNHCGKIKILKKLPTRNNNSYYRIQFLDGINYVMECSRPSIRSGTVQNPYRMSEVDGNGCYGIIDKKSPYLTTAYNLWYNMMSRCHGSNILKTPHYKDKGVYVDSSWRCFGNFYRDIHGLVGFDLWKTSPSRYDLDKDYFGNNFYGADSTIFLPSSYNELLAHKTNTGRVFTAYNKITGKEFKFTSPVFFNKRTKTSGIVDRAFKNQNGQTKTWKFTVEDPPTGFKWRQQFFVDQLQNLIAGIKQDPHGRRHILTAWNPGELESMALPPCHCFSQFYVADGRLSCQMYQRSADFLLGIPFNIASYSLLTHMIAQVCGLGVGEFIHTVGDAHIYLNHIEQVKEQLSREPLPLPKLWLNPDIKDITEFTMDDIKLLDYQSHTALPAPMAV